MIYVGTENGKDYGFYLDKANLKDFIEITEEEHIALIEGQSEGKQIKFFKDKKPILVEPSKETISEDEICGLKKFLSSTDYIVIKIAEGSATQEEYAETLSQRKDARARINYLESLLNSSDDLSND